MYSVFEKKYFLDEVGDYISYGIRYESYDIQFLIDDVSTEKELLTDFVENLNELAVDPECIYDFIEDFILSC